MTLSVAEVTRDLTEKSMGMKDFPRLPQCTSKRAWSLLTVFTSNGLAFVTLKSIDTGLANNAIHAFERVTVQLQPIL